ncbi:hypothetical protein Bbelb_222360 [Branchiostoma belcheri]|nr:hypothetical protein Bbelb_222360 [Branchiostoma belcheri]
MRATIPAVLEPCLWLRMRDEDRDTRSVACQDSNPGPLGFESSTLPLRHTTPHSDIDYSTGAPDELYHGRASSMGTPQPIEVCTYWEGEEVVQQPQTFHSDIAIDYSPGLQMTKSMVMHVQRVLMNGNSGEAAEDQPINAVLPFKSQSPLDDPSPFVEISLGCTQKEPMFRS